MQIRTIEDVDKFFDKFEDPADEVERITKTFNDMWHQGIEPGDHHIITQYFVKRLVMKAYRLGRDHANIAAMETIRRSKR